MDETETPCKRRFLLHFFKAAPPQEQPRHATKCWNPSRGMVSHGVHTTGVLLSQHLAFIVLLHTLLCFQHQRIDHLINNRHQQTAIFTSITVERMGSSSSKGAAAKITAHDRAILDLKVQRDKLRQYNKRVRHKRLFKPLQLGFYHCP